MESLLIAIVMIAFIVLLVKGLIAIARHTPTWKGIIISAILGLLPLYLILCFFGLMGEDKNNIRY